MFLYNTHIVGLLKKKQGDLSIHLVLLFFIHSTIVPTCALMLFDLKSGVSWRKGVSLDYVVLRKSMLKLFQV